VCAYAGGGTGANPVKQIMTDLTERLPPDFIMIMIMEKVRHTYHC
jgi:NAD(P)H-flavin reductase